MNALLVTGSCRYRNFQATTADIQELGGLPGSWRTIIDNRQTFAQSTDPIDPLQSIVVMGVSGAGKSTVGKILAGSLGFEFCDADDLHPPHNVQLMEAGHPLTDEDRWPWLAAVGGHLGTNRATGRGLVLACSALKRTYRDALREHVPDVFFVFLDGPMSIVSQRVNDRKHEFMPPALLASQYRTLEPLESDEFGMSADIVQAPSELVESITRGITSANVMSRFTD